MAGSHSNTEIIGNLGKDPEMRYTQNGQPRCNFSVAVNHKDSQGNKVTDWYGVTAWGATAEAVANYLKKGSSVFVSGRSTYNKWTDNNGNVNFNVRINASTVIFLDKREDGGSGYDGQFGEEYGEPASDDF